ncbi:MAG: MFS transporter [Coriobacteriales bacterium]|jgi:MFS family permease|nr:MFS transporter [Coriobacteriales bacterium]
MSGEKTPFAWAILAGCCALTFGMGTMLNTGGQWFVSVTQELGVGTAQLALYFTVQGLCMAAAAPFVGKFLPKLNTKVLLTVCYVLCLAAVGMMSQYHAVWQWYISGAVLGLAGAFCFIIPAPVILGNWFVKKTGFVVGIAMSFSGIGGAIANPVIAALIPAIGWRTTYIVIAVATAICVLPFTLLILRFKPADMGLKPYGYEETPAGATAAPATAAAMSGVTSKRALRSAAFWILFVVGGGFAFTGGITQLLPTYATSMNLLAIVGLISTVCMVGNVIGKLGLGAISDKLGGVPTGVIGMVIIAVGFVLLLLFGTSAPLVLVGSTLLGCSLSLTAVVAPILARTAFGSKEFPAIYANLNIGLSLIGAFGTTIMGLLFDVTGSFDAVFMIYIGLCALLIVLIILALNLAKRLPREA